MNDEYRYAFALEGQLHFMEAALEILEPIDAKMTAGDWKEVSEYFTSNPVLFKEKVPTALGAVEIIGGIIAFTGTCFAKKVFDEFYDRLLKRHVGSCVEALIKKIKVPDTKLIEFRDIVYFDDIDVAVVIRILTRKTDAQRFDSQLIEAHRSAHHYLLINGKKAPIHCYTVLEGKVDAEPQFFTKMEELESQGKVRKHELQRRITFAKD